MRICLLTYRGNMFCGGQGVYVYYLAEALNALGHDVHVISGPPYITAPEGVTLHKLEALNLYEGSRLSLLSSPRRLFTPINLYEAAAVHMGFFPDIFTFSMRAYLELRDLMSRQRFDVIHDNQTLGYGLLLAKTLGVPIVATIHHPIHVDLAASVAEVESLRTKFRRTIFYSFLIMQGIVARRMARIVTVSETSAKDTIRHFRLLPERVRVVHNGIDIDTFRRRDGVAREPGRVLIVGKTEDKKKGIPFLMEAVRLLKGDVNVRMIVVGSQGADGFGPKLAADLGIGDRVTYTGYVTTEELVRLYSSAEIAVTASLYEGFGLPCAEAMACGTPVIATRAGALPEIVGEDGAGILVPPANPPALAAAIREVLSDASLGEKMAQAARERIEQMFSWKAAAAKTVDVYREII